MTPTSTDPLAGTLEREPRSRPGAAHVLAERVVSWGQLLCGAAIGSFLLLFLFAAHFFTVEADEAWVLLSTMNAFGLPVPATAALASPTVTSGGLHLLVHGLVAEISDDIFLHRLVSVAGAGVLIGLVHATLRRLGFDRGAALSGSALFCAVPGFVFQASLALAEIIATTLAIGGCVHWVLRGRRSARAALETGVLLGLACATRINCLVLLPAIVAFEVLSARGWNDFVRRALVAMAAALVLTGVAVAAYVLVARSGSGATLGGYLSRSTGVGQTHKSIGWVLHYLDLSGQMVPVAVVAAVVAGLLLMAERRDEPSFALCAILVLGGLASWASWVASAPIPHFRYLWPAIPCFWLAAIVEFASLLGRGDGPLRRIALQVVALATGAYQLLAGIVLVGHGESLTLVYQANGISPREAPAAWFQAARDQRALADFVRAQPTEARFYAPNLAATFPITYLSRRTIEPPADMAGNGPRYLVIVPADFSVWRLTSDFWTWRRDNAEPSLRRGGFSAWRIRDGASVPPKESVAAGSADPG